MTGADAQEGVVRDHVARLLAQTASCLGSTHERRVGRLLSEGSGQRCRRRVLVGPRLIRCVDGERQDSDRDRDSLGLHWTSCYGSMLRSLRVIYFIRPGSCIFGPECRQNYSCTSSGTSPSSSGLSSKARRSWSWPASSRSGGTC